MNDLFRNIRNIIEEELRLGTKNFIIYPFSDVGHLVKEILEYDYGMNGIVVDDLLTKYNKNILPTKTIGNFAVQDSVVLLSIGNIDRRPFFIDILDKFDIRYYDVHEMIHTIHVPEKENWFKQLNEKLSVKLIQGEYKYVRVGRDNDGGYIVLDDFKNIKRLYSFGISSDVSFEKDIAKHGIDCFMYDHTIDRLPEENKFFHWKKKGLAGSNRPKDALFSLETLMSEHGDLDNKELILKIDVEGAEWDFLENVDSDLLDNFMQIAFELHDITDVKNTHILHLLKKLRITHTPVWLHGNNYCIAEEAGDIVFSSSMEVLYLNNRCYNFIEGKVEFPWNLDMPNNPLVPEIVLGDKYQCSG